MKKLSIIAAAAAIAASTAAPVVAQEQQSNDPFVATQLSAIPALFIVGGAAVIVAITAGSGTN